VINSKKVLCVVLARAGSKGIPGKNFRDLLGKPLFLWSIEAASQSKYIDEVVFSSNCDNCLNIFHDYFLEREEHMEKGDEYLSPFVSFIERPEKYATATSKNEDALIHALKLCGRSEYDIVVNLQVTSPCRLDGIVDKCIEEYDVGGYDSLLTATKDTPFLWRKEDGKWKYPVDKNHCCNRKMRQEFEEDEFVYHDNGNLYIVDKNVLMDTKCRIGSNPCVFETEGINSLQIDEEFDFELIENIAKAKGLTTLI